MVSPRRADANARNAKFSTGPKTKRGKFRSRKNALRHGLATFIGQDPQLRREAIKLSSAIAHELGYSTDSPFTETIAAAQIELARARAIRHELIEEACRAATGVEPSNPNSLERLMEITGSLMLLDRYER